MKKLLLIETAQNGLKAIKAYLKDSNAKFDVVASLGEALALREETGLIVLLASKEPARYRQDVEMLRHAASTREVKRIVVLPIELASQKGSDCVMAGETEFAVPVPKLEFLTAVAESLGIPPRRAFRILVTLQPEGSNLKYSAMSVDFSESGMAFECTEFLEKGAMLFIAFVNPKTRVRFFLRAEVMRRTSTSGGKSMFYGVRFSGVTDQEQAELRKFITGSA